MIRIILDEVDGKLNLDILNTRNGGHLNVTKPDNFTDAHMKIMDAVEAWEKIK